VYTDDILANGVDPKDILMKLNKYFKLKPDSIHLPDYYLGTKIKKTVLPNGSSAWGQSSSQECSEEPGRMDDQGREEDPQEITYSNVQHV
jgi:hypothetical protein